MPLLGIRHSLSQFCVDIFVCDEQGKTIQVELIPIRPVTLKSLHALNVLISSWVSYFFPFVQTEKPFRLSVIAHLNCLKVSDFWYKRFSSSSTAARQYHLSLSQIDGARIVFHNELVTIIRYPSISGSHRFSSLSQVIRLVQVVMDLHRKGIVHGDIRLANIICSVVQNDLIAT